jgi:hypothetical protein
MFGGAYRKNWFKTDQVMYSWDSKDISQKVKLEYSPYSGGDQ